MGTDKAVSVPCREELALTKSSGSVITIKIGQVRYYNMENADVIILRQKKLLIVFRGG